MNGFIIRISSPSSDPQFWSGAGLSASLNEAFFYSDKGNAKYAAKDLVTVYLDDDVEVVAATKTISVAWRLVLVGIGQYTRAIKFISAVVLP